METDRLPAMAMCGRPVGGKRRVGGQPLSYLGMVDAWVRQSCHDGGWWEAAKDRTRWKKRTTQIIQTPPERELSPTQSNIQRKETITHKTEGQGCRCDICGQILASAHGVRIHRQRAHPEQGNNRLNSHPSQEFPPLQPPHNREQKEFRCERAGCERAFRSEHALRVHKGITHRKKK